MQKCIIQNTSDSLKIIKLVSYRDGNIPRYYDYYAVPKMSGKGVHWFIISVCTIFRNAIGLLPLSVEIDSIRSSQILILFE